MPPIPKVPRLRGDLEATFVRLTSAGFEHVEHFRHAQGVLFLCPKCWLERGQKRYGVHSVLCWFADRRVPEYLKPAMRWHAVATSIDDLSFTGPGRFSVQLQSGCRWHGYVKDGRATILPA